jgi:hypothetical protein
MRRPPVLRLYRDVAGETPRRRRALVVEGARSLAVRSGTNFVPRGFKERVAAYRPAS